MNGKAVDFYAAETALTSDNLNPFIHKVEFPSTFEKIKTAVFTIAVLPLRVAAICGLLVVAWCIACVGLYGLSEEDLRTKPITGWRKKLREVIAIVGQITYRIGGMTITVKGRQATRQEAPILVIAPHSTFLDAVVVYVTGFPSIIARWESGINPWLGKLINFTQPVYVWRDDAESRQNTIREIAARAASDLSWPQIVIFPEGTCTNRSCLITFKGGAFYPGVPVQPVCIRYPNKLDTVTWTWEGPGALKVLWLTLTQVHSSCEIEFLPVYRPNAQEKKDPKLFANNVRKVMAKALGVPVTNYTYGHGRLIALAQRLRLTFESSLVEVQNLRENLGLDKSHADEAFLMQPLDVYKLNRSQFAKKLQVSENEPAFLQLSNLCDVNGDGNIEWFEYLLAVLVISRNGNVLDIMRSMFVMMNTETNSQISRELFVKVTARVLSWSPDKSNATFKAVASNASSITYDDFLKYTNNCDENFHLNGVPSRLKND